MKIKLAISLALAVLVFIFISQNTETVRVVFLAWSVEISLVLLVFIILGSGIVIGWLLSSFLRFLRNRKQGKQQQGMSERKAAVQEGSDVVTNGER